MKIRRLENALRRTARGVFALLLSLSLPGQAQQPSPEAQSRTANGGDLQSKVAELDESLRATREELAQSREEIRQLRLAIENFQQHLTAVNQDVATLPATQPNADMKDRVAAIEEEQSVLQSQVAQEEQKKVESKSKFPVKLTGLLLLNAAYTAGTVDSVDVPQFALPRQPGAADGSLSATMRQTILGVEAQGPALWGASSSANLYADFFGGFPNQDFGVSAGIMRLRTARIRLDWPNTSLVVAQESPFFSPLSPTSLATLGLPALAWAGNLWSWAPQIRAEHSFRFSNSSSVQVQAGLLDSIESDQPAGTSNRQASPGEQSRQPGYASRVSWSRAVSDDKSTTIGVGGYFSPQRYPFDRRVNAWAATADFQIPIANRLAFSGEFYRGNAVGGLGGGQFNSFVASGNPAQPTTQLIGLNSVGAWGQLKFIANSRLEFNAAIGHDNPFASDLERFSANVFSDLGFARNQTSFVNFIFKPESSVLLSLEFRHIQSYAISGRGNTADHINLAAGYQF